jgi:hypothetical protein
MEGAWDHRAEQYTKAAIEREARKGVDYSCEAIYLDPGWDTQFASFIWGDAWLGPMDAFVKEMRDRYGLKDFPARPWPLGCRSTCPVTSRDRYVSAAARLLAPRRPRRSPERRPPPASSGHLPGVAPVSRGRQKRLLDLCAAGATFLMFDGNFWNGGCLDPKHGHPVPYTFEDHIRANVDLAARIHAKYPRVLIEMHDLIAGGSPIRHTPLYYTYGLPGSWDENWGYELMWMMADASPCGACRSITPTCPAISRSISSTCGRQHGRHCAVVVRLTCRHLGIGGTAGRPRGRARSPP